MTKKPGPAPKPQPERSSRKPLVAAAAVAVVLAVAIALLRSGSTDGNGGDAPGASPAAAVSPQEESGEAAVAAASRGDRRGGGDEVLTSDDQAVDYLRELYGKTIENKRTRLKAIEKLIGYLMRKYPDDWQSRVQALLAQAFPGLGDELYAEFQSMQAYNEWLKANREELAKMSSVDRRAAIRDAQDRFFGKESADEIFEEARRQERILQTVEALAEDHETTVDEKLDAYLDVIHESYGDAAPDFLERRTTELMNNFVRLPTVQDDLHAMSAAERAQQLDQIRRGMGLDEAARGRWRELDQQRDEAWDVGERYMQERDEITRSHSGDEQLRRLEELRQRTFGEEADTIRSEEESGFFRFGHRRVYGKE